MVKVQSEGKNSSMLVLHTNVIIEEAVVSLHFASSNRTVNAAIKRTNMSVLSRGIFTIEPLDIKLILLQQFHNQFPNISRVISDLPLPEIVKQKRRKRERRIHY